MSLILLPESERLRATNWNQWKRSVSTILRMQGLMGYVDGNIRPPSKPWPFSPQNIATPTTPVSTAVEQAISPISDPFNSNPFSKRALTQSIETSPWATHDERPPSHLPITSTEWSRLDAAATAHITLNIKSQIVLSRFQDDASAAEIWSSLHARFEKTSDFLVLRMRNRLNSCRYVDGHDLQSHLDNMSKLWEDALAAGAKVDDEEFCHILLSSFPPSWLPLITTLVTINDPIILESSLLAFVDLQSQSSGSVAFTPPTLMSSIITCTNCGQKNNAFDEFYRGGGGAEHPGPDLWRTREWTPQSRSTSKTKAVTVGTTPLLDIAGPGTFSCHPFATLEVPTSRNTLQG